MTIAACYISKQGVVFGADSTSTYQLPSEPHYFKYEQKIFEIGEAGSSQGAITWGMACLPCSSYRELFAILSDQIVGKKPSSMSEIATMWSELFWNKYTTELADDLERMRTLEQSAILTDDQMGELAKLQNSLVVGFCIGGVCLPSRKPTAFKLEFTPNLSMPPTPEPLPNAVGHFWGVPNLIFRLTYGFDERIFADIRNSGKWSGSDSELVAILARHQLDLQIELPIREAIDYVHASIYTTIKALKFSHLSPHCGGPIEIAAITADRPFRWVKHKSFDSAITE